MADTFTDRELEAYLDEQLDAEMMVRVELVLRSDQLLLERLGRINARRNQGGHSIGDIWQRHRLSCPTREDLANCLLGALSDEESDYIRFHVVQIGCRLCGANWSDLQRQLEETSPATQSRRRRFYESSVPHLRWPANTPQSPQ